MKTLKQYVCLVDCYRRPSRRRNTCGRYRVCAKTEDEAKKIVQDAIKFGSVQVYYEDKNPIKEHILNYKEVKKEIFTDEYGRNCHHLVDVISAIEKH